MSPFRTVEGAQAGPTALGILVPPGRRTLVLLRPRALAFDLVPLRAPNGNGIGPGFQEVGQHEAEALARQLCRIFTEGAGGIWVEAFLVPGQAGSRVQAQVGPFAFLACHRKPGQAYQSVVFATLAEAEATAAALLAVLCPPAGAGQELYLNTRNFGR